MFSKTWLRDTAERAIATFAEAALGLWILADGADLFSITAAEGAITAGVIAAGAVVKGAIASRLGDKNSASLDSTLVTVTKAP